VAEAVTAASVHFDDKLTASQQSLDEVRRAIDARLGSVVQEFEMDAELRVQRARAKVQQLISQIEADDLNAVSPLVAKIEEAREALSSEMRRTAGQLEREMIARVNELREASDNEIDTVENQLVAKLDSIRPRVEAIVESASAKIDEFATQMTAGVREKVARSESEIASRLSDLTPRILTSVRDAELQLNEQLEKLEEQSQKMTARLEQRLTKRVNDLVARSRAALNEEVEASSSKKSVSRKSSESRNRSEAA
jgi:tetrahydromethanopterin S-methyltransferase subunit G